MTPQYVLCKCGVLARADAQCRSRREMARIESEPPPRPIGESRYQESTDRNVAPRTVKT